MIEPRVDEIKELGLKFSFWKINPEDGSVEITMSEKVKNSRDFIVMEAIIFPYINVLWLGCITMAVGTGIAIIETPNKSIEISAEDVEILSEDIPGWLVANAGSVTIALDISLTEQLIEEGHAREFVSQLQRMRKEKNLAITDRIKVSYAGGDGLAISLINYKVYICAEILADTLEQQTELPEFEEITVNENLIKVFIQKI